VVSREIARPEGLSQPQAVA